MLDMLTLGWPDLNPRAISMDFEKAAMNSFAAYFPGAELHGCFFHLVQNVAKKVASQGLTAKYRDSQNPDFALKTKMISALAYIPHERLEDALRDLRQQLPEDLEPVLDYFEDNYVGRLQIQGDGSVSRRNPLFPTAMWNVYQRTLDGDSRTNNYAEASHRSLQGLFRVQHPDLLKFIEKLKLSQHTKDAALERYIAGHDDQPRKRNEYKENDRRILRILNRINSQTLTHTLRGLAHTYEMDP